MLLRLQIEAMVPFAFPNPTPASERRRVRNANGLLFCIMGGRPTNVLFDRKTAGGNEGNGPHPAAPVAARRGGSVSGGRQWSSGGGAGGAQSLMPNLEAQLYAGLGSLLEVSKATVFIDLLRGDSARFLGRLGWACRSVRLCARFKVVRPRVVSDPYQGLFHTFWKVLR